TYCSTAALECSPFEVTFKQAERSRKECKTIGDQVGILKHETAQLVEAVDNQVARQALNAANDGGIEAAESMRDALEDGLASAEDTADAAKTTRFTGHSSSAAQHAGNAGSNAGNA